MNRWRMIIAGVVSVACLWAGSGRAQKIGYVNSDSIFAHYRGAADIRQELARAQAVWNQEIAAKRQQIDSLQRSLDDQTLVISSERRKARQEEIRTRRQELETYVRDVYDPRGKADQKNRELSKPMVDKIGAAVRKVALDNGLQMVIDATAGALVYAAKDLDITAEVVDELDREEGGAGQAQALIAVYSFREADPEAVRKQYGKTLSPYFIGALDRTDKVRPVPLEQMQRLLRDKGLEGAEMSQTKGLEIARILNARFFILNKVAADLTSGRITVTAQVYSVDSNLLVSEEQEIATDSKGLNQACERLAVKVATKTGQP
jgi:outer membrane protein